MKAFVIVRVSSQDQLKGYGPDVQWFDDVLPNAPLLGLEVSEQYRRVIQESATGWDRPLFEGAVREALSLHQKKEIEAILFPRQDRESRFIYGSFPLLCEVVRSGLKVFFARERFELDSNNPESTEKYLLKVQQSQAYVEIMKANTARGRRAKAKKGKFPNGGFCRTYGFDYVRKSDTQDGKRIVNQAEAEVITNIYHWLVDDRMSTCAIVAKRRELKIPTKREGTWRRSAVYNILTNPAYVGKTYAYTTIGHKQFSRDKSEWIELPDVTPRIVSDEIFEAAREQLKMNNKKRDTKRQYLLKGHIKCGNCGYAYVGRSYEKDGHLISSRYDCGGKSKAVVPDGKCHNRSWQSEKLDALVWDKLEKIINRPELIEGELKKRENDADQLNKLEDDLKQTERKLKTLDKEQADQFRYAKMGFPEETIINENKRINAARENLKTQKRQLEDRVRVSQDSSTSAEKLKETLKLIQGKLSNLDFRKKTLILEALNIVVYINNGKPEITGSIDPDIMSKQA